MSLINATSQALLRLAQIFVRPFFSLQSLLRPALALLRRKEDLDNRQGREVPQLDSGSKLRPSTGVNPLHCCDWQHNYCD